MLGFRIHESYLTSLHNTGFAIRSGKDKNLLQFIKFPKQYILQGKLYHHSKAAKLVKSSKTSYILTTVCRFKRIVLSNLIYIFSRLSKRIKYLTLSCALPKRTEVFHISLHTYLYKCLKL